MHDFAHVLAALVAVLVSAKLLGALANRFGMPAVLGELTAGVLLGASLLGILDPHDPVMHALSELGVLILLFEIGLHTDLRSLMKVGGAASTVGLVMFGACARTSIGVPPMSGTAKSASGTASS